MKLYIGNKKYSSWSLRPWILLKHFGIPFEEEVIGLDLPDTKQNILKVSPSGRVPCLVDGSLAIWDSLAICEYMAEKYPDKHLWPRNQRDRAIARSISCEMHSGFTALREHLSMKVHESFPGFIVPDAAQNDIRRVTQLWTEALAQSGGPYLFGEFSIADAMYAPVVFRFNSYQVPLTGAPASYVQIMLRHSGMMEWLAAAEKETLRAKRYE